MYDDYEFNAFDLDYTCQGDLDENVHTSYMHNTHDLDEDYARDSQDYQELAYTHYAWYNSARYHACIIHMIAQKRTLHVTLDITCYDDLCVEDLDWKELLQLEGDESVDNITIQDLEYSY